MVNREDFRFFDPGEFLLIDRGQVFGIKLLIFKRYGDFYDQGGLF